jgi:hypothetical protein
MIKKTIKMTRKHFIIYHEQNKLITITPRKWARKNKGLFPNHNFTDKQNNHPTTDEIVIFLEKNFSFKTVFDNAIAIHYNLNKNLNL